MCVVCQGAIPHPPITDVPLWIGLFQVAVTLLVGYWIVFKMRIKETFVQFRKSVRSMIHRSGQILRSGR